MHEESSSSKIWDTDLERKRAQVKRNLRIRRGAIVGLVVCLLIVMAFRTESNTALIIEETTFILYESPEGGEAITLGEWYILSCQPYPAQFGLDNFLRFEVDIENWGNAPDNVDFYYELIDMTSSEFQSLNETDRRSLLRNKSLVRPERGNMHGTFAAWHDGPFTFVMKACASENETLSGVLYSSIEIIQSGQ